MFENDAVRDVDISVTTSGSSRFKSQGQHDRRRRPRRTPARGRRSRTAMRGPGDLAARRSRSRRAPTSPRSRRPSMRSAGDKGIEAEVQKLQQTSMRAAIQPGAGRSARCAAWRSAAAASSSCTPRARWPRWSRYIGLVEVGVGTAAGRRRLQRARRARGRRGAARRRRQPDRPASVHPHLLPVARDGQGRQERARSEGARLSAARRRRRHEHVRAAATSPRRRRARLPRPATGRRCPRAISRSPARRGFATLR